MEHFVVALASLGNYKALELMHKVLGKNSTKISQLS